MSKIVKVKVRSASKPVKVKVQPLSISRMIDIMMERFGFFDGDSYVELGDDNILYQVTEMADGEHREVFSDDPDIIRMYEALSELSLAYESYNEG